MDTSDDSSNEDCDLERGVEVLRCAIAEQKRGQGVTDLWAELFTICGADLTTANQLIRDFSDTIAQGYPKLDVYNYRESITAKTKEHEYLLYALNDGLCFTNRKVDSTTYMALFENEERLAALQAIAPSLEDSTLEKVMKAAGMQVQPEWEAEMKLEIASGLDRLFASVHESPEHLAKSIAQHCPNLEEEFVKGQPIFPRVQRIIEWNYQHLEKLASIAFEMFRAVKLKRHDLNMRYGRERVLFGIPVPNWMLSTEFHFMWDRLLYTGTLVLKKVSETGFDNPMAKPFATLCIKIAEVLCDSLYDCTQTTVPTPRDGTSEPLTTEDFLDLSDRHISTIVLECCGSHKSSSAGEDIFKCYAALFMLYYVCTNKRQELYQLMIEWHPTLPSGRRIPFVHFVFDKWYTGYTTRDLDHLLKGPPELDPELVEFLTYHARFDLAAIIKTRMGDTQGALMTIWRKPGLMHPKKDYSNMFLLSSCTPERYANDLEDPLGEVWGRPQEERRRYYLQMKLNCICHRYNLIAIEAQSKPVLNELLYMMRRKATYNLIHSALDVFIYESPEFFELMRYPHISTLIPSWSGCWNRESWISMWDVIGQHMKLGKIVVDCLAKNQHNEDFIIMQKACHGMRLSHGDKQDVFFTILGAIEIPSSSEEEDTSGWVERFISAGLELPMP